MSTACHHCEKVTEASGTNIKIYFRDILYLETFIGFSLFNKIKIFFFFEVWLKPNKDSRYTSKIYVVYNLVTGASVTFFTVSGLRENYSAVTTWWIWSLAGRPRGPSWWTRQSRPPWPPWSAPQTPGWARWTARTAWTRPGLSQGATMNYCVAVAEFASVSFRFDKHE